MQHPTHYQTLNISTTATQAEIKQAYRRLVKQHHPDQNPGDRSHDRMASINAAYEILGDPQQRQSYDRTLLQYRQLEMAGFATTVGVSYEQRNANAQAQYHQQQTGHDTDEHLKQWFHRVYKPVNRLLGEILKPLRDEIDELSADPFDDQLLENFQCYLDDARDLLQQAQRFFRSMPNPPSVAGVAADLFYCLNQVGDGIDELERFTTSYSEHYLHTGQELFRIAAGLRRDAQAGIRNLR